MKSMQMQKSAVSTTCDADALRATQRSFYSLATLLVLLMSVPRPANAYVDPGSGAMIWQILAASVLGALFYVRKLVMWVRGWLGMRTKQDCSNPPA